MKIVNMEPVASIRATLGLLRFVQAAESDKEYLLELRKLTMTEHLQGAGLFLTDQEHVERLNYKYECTFLVLHQGSVVGAVKYESCAEEVELIQIQVEPKHQAKGYGTAIVLQILNDQKGKIIKLSVLKNNPAVALYERLSFHTVGENEHEYHMQRLG